MYITWNSCKVLILHRPFSNIFLFQSCWTLFIYLQLYLYLTKIKRWLVIIIEIQSIQSTHIWKHYWIYIFHMLHNLYTIGLHTWLWSIPCKYMSLYVCIMPDFYCTETIQEQYIHICIIFRLLFTETHLLCMAIL